jgi:hypothetical protein
VHDGPTIRQTLLHLFDQLGAAKTYRKSCPVRRNITLTDVVLCSCFDGGIAFVSAGLSESVGHPDGPCLMFYSLFDKLERRASTLALPGREEEALRARIQRQRAGASTADGRALPEGFDHFLLMETDVFPIRTNWVRQGLVGWNFGTNWLNSYFRM